MTLSIHKVDVPYWPGALLFLCFFVSTWKFTLTLQTMNIKLKEDNFLCHKVLQEVELGLELRSKDKAQALYMIPEQSIYNFFFIFQEPLEHNNDT